MIYIHRKYKTRHGECDSEDPEAQRLLFISVMPHRNFAKHLEIPGSTPPNGKKTQYGAGDPLGKRKVNLLDNGVAIYSAGPSLFKPLSAHTI